MAETPEPTPKPAREPESVYIYRVEPATHLPVIVGKVFIDAQGDAWVRINAEDLASGIGVENIDGVALLSREDFNFEEPR